ncbi:uncharacterized protein LOC104878980 isoform X2 [Vitis vinifera]|uniref:uncharacterized protein LOC104878980 isoform X2 n=1 Tax=Vitis vinifera TaxID=29760 RepID=UPI00053F3596|nr:uncharacterized protein LOC104878980 isoform X2 [Vitis vinifera]|eukprot:XP_010648329.1 PREDICTED: uncharacterized protein LOC104878980 isoform X2 [Vitis vinifera]
MDTASESYQKMLHESIQRFFAEYEKGVSDFSAFSSIFFRLMQASPDPPLETVWFYSALNFHSNTLLRMLLEPVLPVTSLLSAEDEVLLRKVLYDAVIMEKYTFLNPQIGIQLFGNQLKNIVVTWLFVADNAILYVRENGDQAKAISYINAFSESQLPSQLIKWVATQSGMGEEMGRPKFSTPIAFMKWLLIAEDQGIRVFDHNISKLHAKAMMYKSRVEYELPVCKLDGKTRDNNVFFYTDNEGSGEEKIDGDQEMIDSLNAAMLAAACTVNLTTDGRRKRKGIIDEGKTQFKFGKYHLLENSFGDNHLPFGDDGGSSSGSEVENPVSDEDMEIMEQ